MEEIQAKSPHLNSDLLQKALRSSYGDNVEIIDFDLKSVGGNGANYCSNVYKSTVRFTSNGGEPQEIRLFIKDVFEDISEMEVIKLKEFSMYKEILPKLEELMRRSNQHKTVKFGPRCFLASREKGELYVFEDLSDQEFALGNRWQGFNANETRLILQKLGQFHAASMVLAHENPQLFELVGPSHFHKGAPEINLKITLPNIKHAADYLSSLKDYEHLSGRLLELIPKFSSKMQKMADCSSSLFKVINHADLWVNNLMIKSTQKQEEVVFLDFQLSCYGSPGIDLNYFLHTSVPLDILKNQRYELLRLYFHNLTKTLKCLDYPVNKIPSFPDLLHEIHQTEFYSFYSVTSELPLIALSPDLAQNMSLDSLIEDGATNSGLSNKLFSNSRVQETLKYTLDRLWEMGVLDE